MLRKIPPVLWLVLPLAYVLYVYHLDAAGLLGPDEPRYAAVARDMARTGDWVTPHLWGQPWFEKPALLYWMVAGGFRVGLGPELAPRLPIALLSLGFLAFYWWILRREFGTLAASFATLILGTCAGWVAYSQVGVTDLPLAATLSAAMLLALPWMAKGDTRWLPAAAAFLGLAVLAKGLVPLVLAVPLVLRGRIRDLMRWRVVAPFCIVALPWYVLCYLRNGRTFLDVFFGQQTFGRFYSLELLHGQPWWFYIPVLLAGLLPWTPLVGLLARRGGLRDPRRVFLAAWFVFGLVFFSVAANKLPGYLLPLLPAVTALLGIGLDEIEKPAPWLAACAVLLVAFPIAARILPLAVVNGLTHVRWPSLEWTWFLAVPAAAAVWMLAHREQRLSAALVLTVCAGAGLVYLKVTALPKVPSARALWREMSGRTSEFCLDGVQRNWRYGLNYYSVVPLPDCEQEPRRLSVRQSAGELPYLASPDATILPFQNY